MDKRKPLPINHDLKEYAVKMRKNQTDEENKEYDQKRTEYLESLGFYVLRFENTEVN